MKKFENIEDLAKAAGSLVGGFTKNAAFHKAAAGHHAAQAAHHGEMHAYHKGVHDSLDDGAEHKAFHAKAAGHHEVKKAHHTAMHELHKGYGEDAEKAVKAINDAFGLESSEPVAKTAPTPTTATGVVDGVVASMSGELNTLANDLIKNDPSIKELVRKTIAEQIAKALGREIVPDGVKVAATTMTPQPGQVPQEVLEKLHLVPRGGSNPGGEVAVAPDSEELFAGV